MDSKRPISIINERKVIVNKSFFLPPMTSIGGGIRKITKGITTTKINGELQPIHSSASADHASHPLDLAVEIAFAQSDQPSSPNLARIA